MLPKDPQGLADAWVDANIPPMEVHECEVGEKAFVAGYNARELEVENLLNLIVLSYKKGHDDASRIIPKMCGLEEWARDTEIYERVKKFF